MTTTTTDRELYTCKLPHDQTPTPDRSDYSARREHCDRHWQSERAEVRATHWVPGRYASSTKFDALCCACAARDD